MTDKNNTEHFRSVYGLPQFATMDDFEYHQAKKGICPRCNNKLDPPVSTEDMQGRYCQGCSRLYMLPIK